MNQQLSTVERIENRIDKGVVGTIGLSANRGMVVSSMEQAMEIAKLMSVSGNAVPAHLRSNPGACLAVAIQGYEWGVNPFAIANKTYVVNDRLGYESALYHAVLLRRAPIKGRLKCEYAGEGMNRVCRVSAELAEGGTVEYTSPKFSTIPVKNSPLWKADPDQQQFYYSVRAFARRHFPDVMMGIYTADELQDGGIGVNATTVSTRRTDEFDAKLAAPALIPGPSEGQTIDTTTGQLDEAPADEVPTIPADLPVDTQSDESALPEPSDAEAVATWEGFTAATESAAMDAGVSSGDLSAFLAKRLKLAGYYRKENTSTVAWRLETLGKVRAKDLA